MSSLDSYGTFYISRRKDTGTALREHQSQNSIGAERHNGPSVERHHGDTTRHQSTVQPTPTGRHDTHDTTPTGRHDTDTGPDTT